MEFRKLKNKDNEVLTTKEGKELQELRLEEGDVVIPLYNNILEKTRDAEVKGKPKKITNYSMKCKAKDKNGIEIMSDGSNEVFVVLTPAQAKSMKKKVEEGIQLNQERFVAYKYDSENYGEQIGIGVMRVNTPAKSWEDFEKD